MRKAALAAGGFALAVALAACNDGVDGQAAPAGGDQNSATVFRSMQKLVDTVQESTNQSQTAKFSTQMKVEGRTVTATGEGRFTSENPAMSMTAEAQGQQAEMRLIDTSVYIQVPEEMSSEQPWVEISPDGDGLLSQILGPQLEQIAAWMNVSTFLERMKAAGTITNSKATELDGQPATHYSIDYNALEATEQQDSLMDIPEEQTAQMSETISVELWLDEHQLPMKFIVGIEFSPESASAPTISDDPIIMQYTDWGTSFDIEAPPADKIGSIMEILPN